MSSPGGEMSSLGGEINVSLGDEINVTLGGETSHMEGETSTVAVGADVLIKLDMIFF